MPPVDPRLASKYDPACEKEVTDWINQLLDEEVGGGALKTEKGLKDGVILVKLMQHVYQKTPNKPAACNKVKLKFNTSDVPFKQRENIEIFMKAATAFGVPKDNLFPTEALFEGRNMAQVLAAILSVGTECKRHGFEGPTIGPNPTEKNVRHFTQEQLAAGKAILGGQSGWNKGASQSGMAMGGVRHIADIKCDDMDKEGQGVLSAQSGWNKGASQKGMAMGAVRHVADIDVEEASKAGQAVLGGQSGWNKGASQQGMSMGSVRHVSDIDGGEMDKEGQTVLSGQSGWNKGASQAGMKMGASRHVADIDAGQMSQEGQGHIGYQAGWNKGASQAGMVMGATRHVADIEVEDISDESKAAVGLQMGSNQGASQSGMSYGKQRMIVD